MSIFVDETETFPITIYYKQVKDEIGNLLYTDVSPEQCDGWEILTCKFCQPSAGIFSDILEQATVVNSYSHKPVLRTRMLRDLILFLLMKEWSVVNENGQMIPICEDSIRLMDIKVANLLFIEYIKTTKLTAVLKAVIRDERSDKGS